MYNGLSDETTPNQEVKMAFLNNFWEPFFSPFNIEMSLQSKYTSNVSTFLWVFFNQRDHCNLHSKQQVVLSLVVKGDVLKVICNLHSKQLVVLSLGVKGDVLKVYSVIYILSNKLCYPWE